MATGRTGRSAELSRPAPPGSHREPRARRTSAGGITSPAVPTPQPTEFASSVHLYSQNGRYLYRIKPDAAARLLALRRVSRMGKGSGKLRSLQLVDSLVTAQDMGQRVATTVHGSGIGQTSEAPVAGERGRPVHCWHMHCTDAEGRVFAPPDAQEEFLQVLFECGAQPVVKQIKKGNR